MKIHGIFAFLACRGFCETGATPFDLHAAASLLLYVFDICALMAHNLGTEVEARQGLHFNWDAFFRPFPLYHGKMNLSLWALDTYSAEFIPFEVWLTAAETALIDEIWKLLLHQLVNLRYCLVQSLLRGACNVQVERGILDGH